MSSSSIRPVARDPRHGWVLLALLALLTASPLVSADADSTYDSDGAAAAARLLGYVRYFHPSDQAVGTDWNHQATLGMLAVGFRGEGQDTPAERAQALEAWIHPIAPTVRVFPATAPTPPLDPALLHPTAEAARGPVRRLAWRHLGVALDAKLSQWSSDRIDDAFPPGMGNLAQKIDAAPFRGKTVTLRVRLRANSRENGGAQIWLHVERPVGTSAPEDSARLGLLRDPEWRSHELSVAVARDAVALGLGVAWIGGGSVRVDEIELAVAGQKKGTSGLQNPSFEQGETGLQPVGWLFPYESLRAGYRLLVLRDEGCVRGACAEIVADPIATPNLPEPSAPLVVDLGGGVRAAIPLALWADSRGTLPHQPRQGGDRPLERAPQQVPGDFHKQVPADSSERLQRAERLAAVALGWGAIQHFHATLDDAEVDWATALTTALDRAVVAATDLDLLRTLEQMAANLRDANAWVTHPDHGATHQLPLAAAWVEGRVVVTDVPAQETRLRRGDRIVAIGDQPMDEVLAEIERRTAGATPAARRAEAIAAAFAGRSGERVRLRIERRDHESFDVELSRTLEYPASVAQERPTREVRPRVVYLDLRRLHDAEFEALLPEITNARGLIFDLRGAPTTTNRVVASLVDRPAQSPNWQIPIALLPDRRERDWLSTFWNVLPKAPRLRAKVVFLADERAVGYAETLLALAKSERWGEIVGETSGGSNGTINWLNLPRKFRLAWTGMRVLGPDGEPLQGRGITPTIPIAPTLRGLEQGRDEVLDRAIESIVGKGR